MKTKTMLKFLFKPKQTLRILSLGYFLFKELEEKGWYNTFNTGKPVDVEGKPIPWFTYDSIEYLNKNLNENLNVFEYGSGFSTLYFSKRVRKIISIEHDINWYNSFKKNITNNITYIFKDLTDGYTKQIMKFEEKFDIVVIDGRKRVECSKLSLKKLSPRGVIIWDNSDRDRYKEGFGFLGENGFLRKDFIGYGPINLIKTNTSIFYREKNCLNL